MVVRSRPRRSSITNSKWTHRDQLNTVKKSSICTGTQNNFILCENIAINDIVALFGGWFPINRFNPPTFLCLSQASTWIFNVICRIVLCSVSLVKMRGDCSFCWYWWNLLKSSQWWLYLEALWTFGSVASSLNEIRKGSQTMEYYIS